MNPIQVPLNSLETGEKPTLNYIAIRKCGYFPNTAQEQRLSESGVVMNDLSDSPAHLQCVVIQRPFSAESLNNIGDKKRILKNGEVDSNPRQEQKAHGKLSEKYIAGFLDADGSIQVMWRNTDRKATNPEIMRPYLMLQWTQKTTRDNVLNLIQRRIGGKLRYSPKGCTDLRVWGTPAEMALNRIRKHLVIKRYYADAVLSILRQPVNVKQAKEWLKEQRKIKSLPLPNFPTRKWLAGYFDGDGSFQVRIGRGRTSAQFASQISASAFDAEGIELIKKSFGGTISPFAHAKPHILAWTITMPPSKVKQFLGYFAKHLIIKKDQAYFILGCAKMGNSRDGETIKQIVKQLKAQPHRLNESEVDVSSQLESVNFGIKTRAEIGMELWSQKNKCIQCESNDHYYCDGLCRACYDSAKNHRPKRQSDVDM